MKCQSCELPATIHLTEIVNGKKKELHLCHECAEKPLIEILIVRAGRHSFRQDSTHTSKEPLDCA